MAGATLATGLIVETLKGLPLMRRLPTRLVAFVVALGLLAMGTASNQALNWGAIPLLVLNALLVTSASIGTWHTVAWVVKKTSSGGGS